VEREGFTDAITIRTRRRNMTELDYSRLQDTALKFRGTFANASPFPHAVLDDFLPLEIAQALAREFPQVADGWKHYHHYNERKLAITELAKMPSSIRKVFEDLLSQDTIDFVESLTGLKGLISDPDMEGAGMHKVLPGGHLNIHTDFLTHTKKRSWRRQINLLIYLNEDWEEDWQGNLELWSPDMKQCVHSVAPKFNRCVIFNTVPQSYHGHPRKLACPEGESRKHILLYYYTDEGKPLALAPTDYQARPGDSAIKKGLVAFDGALLRIYTAMKGHTQLSDRILDRILKHL
jgi:Rps23 Pro-64 3,4-dihydroxylase Tpa1-like proline 4-hydroxylase